MNRAAIAVVDPAGHTPELACFNHIACQSQIPVQYHLPGLFGFDSFHAQSKANLTGIIVFGSSTSIHDNPSWQQRLLSWLTSQAEQGTPILALCYGHQLFAHHFGGKVEFINQDRGYKAKGLRETKFYQSLLSPHPTSVPLVVSHREIVATKPPGMEVIATSTTYTYDGLVHNSLPIWTLQAHPEAVPDFLTNQQIDLADADLSKLEHGHRLIQRFLNHCQSK